MEREAVKDLIIAFSLILLLSGGVYAQTEPESNDSWLKVVDKTCIYDNNSHSAFTSLKEWKGNMYVAFREGQHHVATGDYGQIRIMRKSRNGWKSQHVFSLNKVDLRDPNMLIINNKLFLYTLDMHYSELTNNGWTDLKVVERNVPGGPFVWKKRIYKNEAYGFGYRGNNWPLLMKSKDGIKWELIREYRLGGNANESDMVFVSDTMFVCMRVDTPSGSNSLWGKSIYPFTECSFSVMDVSVASPEMIQLDNDTFLLAGREYECDGVWGKRDFFISLLKVDKNGKVLNRYVVEKDCKDCGYTSFYRAKNGVIIMSYYVGDKDKSKINLLTFKVL